MARTNYSFAKRQKEIERKKKQEEKHRRKLQRTGDTPSAPSDAPSPAPTGEK